MADEQEQAGEQIQDELESQPTVENPSEEGAGSPPVVEEDWQGKFRAAEEQRIRYEERNRYLEQSQRLQEEHFRRQQAPVQESSLSPELAELDKTLDPLFSRRMKGHIDPLANTIAQLKDQSDATDFKLYLMHEDPELLKSEDGMNRVFQQVEQVRQQAAQVYGKYLTRIDAYAYLVGVENLKEKGKSRAGKKQTQVKEEAKRQLQIQATQSGESGNGLKKAPADVDSLRRKMMAGERLTSEERAKFRKSLEGQNI